MKTSEFCAEEESGMAGSASASGSLLDGASSSEGLPPSALSLENICFSYTNKPFIQDLSVSIPKGKITSILGPNGCGKSTLLNIADDLLKPHSGEVYIDGVPSSKLSSKERARKIALLSQGVRPCSMSVESLVTHGRYPHQGHFSANDADKEIVHEAMKRAGVLKFKEHDVRTLSGGERQRAYIAMTLAQSTDTIALDEPTTFLDVFAAHEIMELVYKLNSEEGKTILMVIHDLDLALRFSDHLLVMKDGHLVCNGGVDKVLAAQALEKAFGVEICPCSIDGRQAYVSFPLSKERRAAL